MKKLYFLLSLLLFMCPAFAQTYYSFYVGGDLEKFYPVIFNDGNWGNNKETEIGRSTVHYDASWRGSLMSKFNYHVSSYGNGSSFIHAEIQSTNSFIAGWRDITSFGGAGIIIWLRGSNTYFLSSTANVTAIVHDGIQNALN